MILPGLDGTGQLLEAAIAALGSGDAERDRLAARAIAYPRSGGSDYDALLAHARSRLPSQGRYVLIAESFSGPIGVRLAAERPAGLIGLVLCASFASAPAILMPHGAARVLASAIPHTLLPARVIESAMLGRWATPHWRARTRQALAQVSPRTVSGRLRAALRVDASDALMKVDVPVLYLQASDDRVVLGNTWRKLRALRPTIAHACIQGPHFLLQAAPDACAAAIRRWLRTLHAVGST